MDIEEGGNIDDNVEFNNLSDLDVFTRQYIGTSLQGRDDAISVIDEEESNSTNASTELNARTTARKMQNQTLQQTHFFP